MKKLFAGIILMSLSLFASTQTKHSFTLGQHDFILDGKPFQIISGEMHPARIPKQYWLHRIQMAKAMGCNTIAMYVFWNYHESSPGVFDFTSENRDIASFIRLCAQEKMWVLIRPGPYVCGEWDFGGLPAYLLREPDIKIRCMDKRYMNAVSGYIARLSKEILPLQCSKGGPILMLQLENEYGSFGNDKNYLEELRRLWKSNGITIPFYTADGPTAFMLEAGHIKGTAIGLDSGGSEEDFEQASKADPLVPAFSSETYPGWLTHWGEQFAKPDTTSLKHEVEFLLKTKRSFNLYVLHGGTNFGFTAGANSFSSTQFQPDITSYDYDAPINEQGQPTAKYFMLRRLIAQYTGQPLQPLPALIPCIEIPSFMVKRVNTIWNNLPAPYFSPSPLTMESLGQNQGLILYRTKLIGHKSGKLTIHDPHDYALVFLNRKFIDTIFRDKGNWTIDLPKTDDLINVPELDILVEGMGHINFAQYMIDRKGITDRVTLNGMTLFNWEIYSLPMDYINVRNSCTLTRGTLDDREASFFKGDFDLEILGDTYLDLSNFSKGFVYINGHNLGRYWNVGPQQRLYCPAPWLKKGKNEIIIFDLHQIADASVKGVRSLEN
jgi:beta-galactosidase